MARYGWDNQYLPIRQGDVPLAIEKEGSTDFIMTVATMITSTSHAVVAHHNE